MYIMKLNNKPNSKNKIYIKQRRDGDSAEKWFEKWLENGYIDRDWELTTTGWKVIDYVSAKEEDKNRVYIEMKGRNISIHNYRTTMIGESKIKKARKYLDQLYNVSLILSNNDEHHRNKVPFRFLIYL